LLIIALACTALAGLIIYLFILGRGDGVRPAAVLHKGYLEQTVEADAMIESAHKAEVYAPSGLKVKEVFVSEGDIVQEGDLLAKLDTEALEYEIQRAELNITGAEANMSDEQKALVNSVTSARNSLSSAQVSLQSARREYDTLLTQKGQEAAVTAARINLDAARRSYEDGLSIYESGGIAVEALNYYKDTLDKAQSAYDETIRGASDSIDRAKEALDAAQIRQKTANDTLNDAIAKNSDPAAAALELQRVAYSEKQMRLRDASIIAPAAGAVTLVNAKEGAPASGLMFVVEENTELIARARVVEAEVALIALGGRCLIRPAGGDQVLEGSVTLLPLAAERDSTGVFSAVVGDDAYFIVEAAIENPQPGLLIGMNAKVSFVVGSRDSCFAVPGGLVNRDGERCYVITRDKIGRDLEIPVAVGLETRRMTEIISDSLYEGMEIYSRVE
jgi:multidrug efflux pump subunit AcrA (membrane-fusion protein)